MINTVTFHLNHPFSDEQKKINFSVQEKIAVIAASVFIGTFTGGIEGFAAFYALSASMKAYKISHSSDSNNQLTDNSALHNEKEPVFITPNTYPTSVQERRFPPISAMVDTIVFNKGKIQGKHPKGIKLFSDDEIKQLHQPKKEVSISDKVKGHITDGGKIVIQQQAIRGCTAAVTAMLIHDAKGSLSQEEINKLAMTNLGRTKTMMNALKSASLNPIITKCETLEKLQQQIQSNGPAIISISGEIGGHVVVVDQIDEDGVRLRDPYHGWDITVTTETFLRCYSLDEDVIQIQK